jgi:hypothetical protein
LTHQGDQDIIDSLEQLLIKELTSLKITKKTKPLIPVIKRIRSQDLPLVKHESFKMEKNEVAFKDDSLEPVAHNMEESKDEPIYSDYLS